MLSFGTGSPSLRLLHGNQTDYITLHIKDNEWQGMFIDFFGDDVEDKHLQGPGKKKLR